MAKIKRQIILLGINHVAQWNRNSPKSKALRKKLLEIAKTHGIDFIAEEFSKEALSLNRVKKTICREITELLKINYKLCDLDSKERKKYRIPLRNEVKAQLGIKGLVLADSEEDKLIETELRKYDPIRESYWLEKIRKEDFQNLVFVCGSSHLQGFKSILVNNGYEVTMRNIKE